MPKKKLSVLKRARQAEKRHQHNLSIKSATKTAVSKVRKAISENKPDSAKPALFKAVKALDKAAQKGVLHKKTAARKKSRLMRQFNKLSS